MHTVSTWLRDSTAPDSCSSTPLSAILTAAIMYVMTIRRNSAIGTMSSMMVMVEMISLKPCPSIIWPMAAKTDMISAMIIRTIVIVWVSICSGVFLDTDFFAEVISCDAKDSSPNALTLK